LKSSKIEEDGTPSADPETIDSFLVVVHKDRKPITVAVVQKDTILYIASRGAQVEELDALNTRYRMPIEKAVIGFLMLMLTHDLRKLDPAKTETVGIVFPRAVDQWWVTAFGSPST